MLNEKFRSEEKPKLWKRWGRVQMVGVGHVLTWKSKEISRYEMISTKGIRGWGEGQGVACRMVGGGG